MTWKRFAYDRELLDKLKGIRRNITTVKCHMGRHLVPITYVPSSLTASEWN